MYIYIYICIYIYIYSPPSNSVTFPSAVYGLCVCVLGDLSRFSIIWKPHLGYFFIGGICVLQFSLGVTRLELACCNHTGPRLQNSTRLLFPRRYLVFMGHPQLGYFFHRRHAKEKSEMLYTLGDFITFHWVFLLDVPFRAISAELLKNINCLRYGAHLMAHAWYKKHEEVFH